MSMHCDPCTCPEMYYRDEMTWQKAVILLLCQAITKLEEAIAASEAPPPVA